MRFTVSRRHPTLHPYSDSRESAGTVGSSTGVPSRRHVFSTSLGCSRKGVSPATVASSPRRPRHRHGRRRRLLLCSTSRDLKPDNVLLDRDMNPKISDFGSAVTLSSDASEEHTSRVVGTCGYKAPEYASRGIYSVKTDVFSFGVLALAVISGRKNIILEHQGDTVGNLVRDAWQLWHDGRLHEHVDPILADGFELAEVKQYAQVALLCTQEDPLDRPTMSDVTALLIFESISLLPDPKQPSQLIDGGATGGKLSTYVSQSSRAINITISSSAPVSTRVCIFVEPET